VGMASRMLREAGMFKEPTGTYDMICLTHSVKWLGIALISRQSQMFCPEISSCRIGQLVIAAAFVSDFLTLLISSILKTSLTIDNPTTIDVLAPLAWAIIYLLLFIFIALKVMPRILRAIVTWYTTIPSPSLSIAFHYHYCSFILFH
jgi:hypothetical protein